MIGIDTNVLVRYLCQDDPQQSKIANQLFEKTLSETNQGFVSNVVLTELSWVLQSIYKVNDLELIEFVQGMLLAPQLQIENREAVRNAVDALARNTKPSAGFVDYLVNGVATEHGCEYCVTFDKSASRSVGMNLLRK